MPGRARRRGAPRRKIKALTRVKHHVGTTESPVGPGDVVLRDERSSLWPGGGTTLEPPNARASPATWCFATKVQGFDEGGGTTSEPPNPRSSPATWCPAMKDQGSVGGEAPRLTRVDKKKKELTTDSPPPLFVVNSNHLLMPSALICIRHK